MRSTEEACSEVTEIGDILHDELLINDESGDGSKLLEETTGLDDSGLPNSLQSSKEPSMGVKFSTPSKSHKSGSDGVFDFISPIGFKSLNHDEIDTTSFST